MDGSGEWTPWTVDSIPAVVIGDDGAHEDALLASVRHARRFSGGYVVTTGLPVGVRTFDETGRFLRWLGLEGHGPGEFRSIDEMWVTEGDTVIVADNWQNRVTYLEATGELVRTVRHESGGSFKVGDSRPRVISGRFSDGSLLSVQQVLPAPPAREDEKIAAGSDRYFREVPTSGSPTLITEATGSEYAWHEIPGDPWPFWVIAPFAPSTAYATVDSLLVLADSRTFEVEFWSSNGRQVGHFARDYEIRPLTDEVWEGELERRLKAFTDQINANGNRWGLNVEGELASIRRQFRAEARLPTLPTHASRMLVGPGGNLWIQAWSDDLGRRSTVWHIFLAATQRFVGTVELPARFRPTAIYEDAILGVHRDEWDVETLREYKIDRRPTVVGAGS